MVSKNDMVPVATADGQPIKAGAFTKATRKRAKLRAALIGPPNGGKTFSALKLATYLGGRIAVIDTEHESASKYAPGDGEATNPETGPFDFDTMTLTTFSPQRYIDAIKTAEASGYDIIIIDSLSHAWVGKGGVLEMHDDAVARQRTQNSYTAWKDVTPHHMALIEAMLQSKCHVIATMRSKVEYVQEKDANGKPQVRKVGMAPVQRDGMEYEFDLIGDLDIDNTLVVTKTRCSVLNGAVIKKPGKALADTLKTWLGSGTVETPKAPPATITKDQSRELLRIAQDRQGDMAKLLTSFHITTLDDLPADKFDAVKAVILKKPLLKDAPKKAPPAKPPVDADVFQPEPEEGVPA
jgi:hypothetical protein